MWGRMAVAKDGEMWREAAVAKYGGGVVAKEERWQRRKIRWHTGGTTVGRGVKLGREDS